MGISRDDAKESLKQVEATMDASRTLASYAGSDLILLTWGVIWCIGFLSTHFLAKPHEPLVVLIGPIWDILILAGILVSIWAGRRMPIQNVAGRRIGFLWGAVYVYACMGMVLLWPFLDHKMLGSLEGAKSFCAIASIIPLFVWVIMGLWLEANYLAWLGVLLTGLTMAGFYLFHDLFYIWMAVVCGGIMMGAGLYLCAQCRRAKMSLAKELPNGA